MHNAKSYMVPKMIFANVLAVIMMTFEQHAPAEMKDKPQKVIGDQPSQTDGMMKVSHTEQVKPSQDVAQKEPVIAKKRMHHTQHVKTPRTHLIKAKSAPIDCCFRGYRS